ARGGALWAGGPGSRRARGARRYGRAAAASSPARHRRRLRPALRQSTKTDGRVGHQCAGHRRRRDGRPRTTAAMIATPARHRPLVTVVIPTYNDTDLLFGAIERFKAQTSPNVEMVGAAEGRAEPVAPKLRNWPGFDARITVVRRPVNGGVPAALQTGLEHARGDYVHLSSTNDLVEPRFLEASIQALERHAAAGMCFSEAG